MYHYRYVTKKELAPVKNELIKLINQVQDEIRNNYFTFQYKFVGSVERNMVTFDPESNIGYDFDVNLEVNDEKYGADKIKHVLMNAFNNAVHSYQAYGSYDYNAQIHYLRTQSRYNYCRCSNCKDSTGEYSNLTRLPRYDYCEDSTRVFTIKVKDNVRSKIIHSCDFAVVHNYTDKYGVKRQQYIHADKKQTPIRYLWEKQPDGFYALREKTDFCKDNHLWPEVRDLYLEKKNHYGSDKASREVFAQTVHQICQQNGFYRG